MCSVLSNMGYVVYFCVKVYKNIDVQTGLHVYSLAVGQCVSQKDRICVYLLVCIKSIYYFIN